MRKTAALGAGLAVTSSGAAAAGGENGPSEPDFNITNRSELSEASLRAELDLAMEATPVQNIDQMIQQEAGVTSAGQYGLEIETDDPKINMGSPVLIFSGYSADEGTDAGVMTLLVGDPKPEDDSVDRQPLMAFGQTAEEPDRDLGIDNSSDGHFNLKTFVPDSSGEVTVAQQDRVAKSAYASATGNLQFLGWKDKLGCGACTAIVATLCEGTTGSVSRYACLEACAPFISSFWGYGACGGACFVIVDAINDYGCLTGAGTICAAIGLC